MKKQIWIASVLGCLLLTGLNVIFAEDKIEYDEEVVVTATRTEETSLKSPGMTEVITKEEIEASGATTVSELLDEKGFDISSYGGASGSATVGLDGNKDQTVILVNGIPANSGTLSKTDLSYFPTAGISRIEVAHGPLSALYGYSALGGVVNIITDLTGEPYNNVNLAYGKTDHSNTDSGKTAFTMQQNKYGLAFGGSTDNGFRKNSETENYFFMYQYDFIQEKDESLSLYIQSMVKDNELPGPGYAPSLEDDQKDQNHSINLNGKKYLLGGLWEYKTYGNYWKSTGHNNGDFRFDYTNYGIDAAGLYALGNHELLVGTNLVDSSTDSILYGDHSLDNAGFYTQDSLNLNERWKLISGLRWDTGSDYSSPVCPKVSLIYSVTDNFSVKIGYGKAFRAPTISDLYTPSVSYDGGHTYYSGNPDLKPEKGDRYDITGEWIKNRNSVSLNLYRSFLTDGIKWVNTASGGSPQNVDKMNVAGLNLTWKTTWNQFLNSSVKYSLTDKETWNSATDTYDEDNFFGKNKLTLGLNFKYSAFRSNLSWEYVWGRSKQTDYSTYTSVEMKDYDVVNWDLAYNYNEAITYKFSIHNLMDEEYDVFCNYPMSPRTYSLSINYRF